MYYWIKKQQQQKNTCYFYTKKYRLCVSCSWVGCGEKAIASVSTSTVLLAIDHLVDYKYINKDKLFEIDDTLTKKNHFKISK